MNLLLRTIQSFPKGKFAEELIFLLDKDCDPHKRISVLSELIELERQDLIYRDMDGKWRRRYYNSLSSTVEVGGADGQGLDAVPGTFSELPHSDSEVSSIEVAGEIDLKKLLGYFKVAVRSDPRGAMGTIPESHSTKWQLISGGIGQLRWVGLYARVWIGQHPKFGQLVYFQDSMRKLIPTCVLSLICRIFL